MTDNPIDLMKSPHRRFNPLTQEWVLVSPQRALRPWLGQVEKTPPENLPSYDPTCYLCPGNQRAGQAQNPDYSGVFIFDNDFPALLPESAPAKPAPHELLVARPETGICKVVCFSPRHDLTIPEMALADVTAVIQAWSDETARLFAHPGITYVQVFENKGAMMGCSNPHPHSQIWAQSHLPTEPGKELRSQREYFGSHGSPLLLDYLAEEERLGERVLAANAYFTALVPFWAVWPFEVLLIARRAVPDLPSLESPERQALADLYQQITTCYDNLFSTSFPYSMGYHQAPNDGVAHPEWVLHAHFYPPLLRSATIRKFMVGYEMLGMPQRDLTPEMAAVRLREAGGVHYRKK
jgi:UDPglucose--hexose-1-phosphate uridylyltransferase